MEAQRILVFGDGRHLFRTIRWILEYKGYEVSLAPNPEIALELLLERDYELIIAKPIMGDLQGLEVLKKAKRLNPVVKIMVASSNGNAAFPYPVRELLVAAVIGLDARILEYETHGVVVVSVLESIAFYMR